ARLRLVLYLHSSPTTPDGRSYASARRHKPVSGQFFPHLNSRFGSDSASGRATLFLQEILITEWLQWGPSIAPDIAAVLPESVHLFPEPVAQAQFAPGNTHKPDAVRKKKMIATDQPSVDPNRHVPLLNAARLKPEAGCSKNPESIFDVLRMLELNQKLSNHPDALSQRTSHSPL